MQGIYYAQFKLTANTLTNPRELVSEMDYYLDVMEVSETQIIEAVLVSQKVLRVVVSLVLELDMELSEIQQVLPEASYGFSYDDGHQRIESSELLEVSDEPTTSLNLVSDVGHDDMFEHPELWPGELGVLVNHYSPKLELEGSYETVREFLSKVEGVGFTFDYGLDAQPFDLRRKIYPAAL